MLETYHSFATSTISSRVLLWTLE